MKNGQQSSITITKRHDRSLLTALLQFLIKPFGALISKPGKPLPAGSPQLTPHSAAAKQCNIIERKVDDIYIYDITAKNPSPVFLKDAAPNSSRTRRIYYIAGGSFCQPPSSDHWKFCTELSVKIPHSVISLISPPLAPSCPAPVTIPRLVRLYKILMTDEADESISFVGDSSGGNLVFSLVLAALNQYPTLRSPENIMLIAPVVDIRFTNPAIEKVQRKDPLLRRHIEVQTANSWASDWPLYYPRLSPVLADLSILKERRVKVHGVTGGYDILTPDTRLFREKCDLAGIEGQWLEWDGQMHCFPIAFTYRLPESVEGKDWVIDTLTRQS